MRLGGITTPVSTCSVWCNLYMCSGIVSKYPLKCSLFKGNIGIWDLVRDSVLRLWNIFRFHNPKKLWFNDQNIWKCHKHTHTHGKARMHTCIEVFVVCCDDCWWSFHYVLGCIDVFFVTFSGCLLCQMCLALRILFGYGFQSNFRELSSCREIFENIGSAIFFNLWPNTRNQRLIKLDF